MVCATYEMWYHSQQVREIFSSPKYVCAGCGTHPASYQWVMGAVSPGSKRPGREDHQLHSPSAKGNNE